MKCSVLQLSRPSLALCVLLMLLLQGAVQGCFISDCPKGGKKRSVDSLQPTRQCMSCGHNGVGQCVGPSICCGRTFGCLMGTPEAKKCQQEDTIPIPCMVRGRHCGKKNRGNCMADGICCVIDACWFTSQCEVALGQQTGGQLTNHLLPAWLTNHSD